jgi:shikimate dehydrogenase
MEKRRFSLLGHPVRHSVSPAIHAAAIRALGLPHSYSALDIPSEGSLRRIVQEIRRGAISGANVTIPYKRIVLDMVDEVAPSAAEVGAANVLVRDTNGRVVAHNTDADALATELAALAPELKVSRAAIIGCGGAGLAAILAAKKLGFKVIGVTSRSWVDSEATFQSDAASKARSLGALTSPWPSEAEVPITGKASRVLRLQWRELAQQADLIIQATSAGMSGADPGEQVSAIVPWNQLPAHTLAYDVVYRPRVTRFMKDAQARGLRAENGLGMLVRQAVLSFSLWTGFTPPQNLMRTAAEHALSSGLPNE